MATIERQTAYLTTIGTLLAGNFVKAEAHMQPSFLRTASGREVSRVHIIAVIVSFGDGEATLDDGSGKITARSFDNPGSFTSFSLGDIIRVIGKVRAFNEQQYLIPEIIKKITNKQFVTLHKLALQKLEAENITQPQQATPTIELTAEVVVADDIPIDADDNTPHTPFDDVIARIKELDTGDGAAIEQIIETIPDSEKLIHHLLETGDIFEIRPGRVKLLD